VNLARWTTWLILGVGVLVTGLVIWIFHSRWSRRSKAAFVIDEDLPWEDLLELLRKRGRELADSGAEPAGELPPEQLLKLLLSQLPDKPGAPRAEPPRGDREFLANEAERRSSPRRWGNPTEVYLGGPVLPRPLHGLVFNRSATGLAIFVDTELQQGNVVKVRAVEAPEYVPWVEIEVRHCQRAGRNFFIGCQFQREIPWNVRVWFG
jgi:hypothetical protein